MWTTDINEIVIWVVLAFAGGVFGAAVGGLCSFVFCGVLAIVSSIFMLTGNAETAGLVDAWGTWGPLVGPQTAFVGGGWAAVYAKYRAGFANGRDICQPLVKLNRPDVLAIGGLGGVCGALLTWLFWLIPSYTVAGKAMASSNCVAAGVAVAAIIGRCILGRTGPFGKVAEGQRRWVESESACWLPWQHRKSQIMMLAIAVGLPTAFLTYINSNTHLLIFGLMTVLFLFMILGQAVIAGHHFAICAYFATAATGNVLWGLAFAILAGFFCEICAFLFTAHGDSHIDPPTCGIMICGFLQPLLLWAGLMPYAPMTGANTSKTLMKLGTVVAPNGDYTGIIALVTAAVVAPLALHMLRQLPPKRKADDVEAPLEAEPT